MNIQYSPSNWWFPSPNRQLQSNPLINFMLVSMNLLYLIIRKVVVCVAGWQGKRAKVGFLWKNYKFSHCIALTKERTSNISWCLYLDISSDTVSHSPWLYLLKILFHYPSPRRCEHIFQSSTSHSRLEFFYPGSMYWRPNTMVDTLRDRMD